MRSFWANVLVSKLLTKLVFMMRQTTELTAEIHNYFNYFVMYIFISWLPSSVLIIFRTFLSLHVCISNNALVPNFSSYFRDQFHYYFILH